MSKSRGDIAWTDAGIRKARIDTVLDHADKADLEHLVEIAEPGGKEHACDYITGLGHCAITFAPHVSLVDAFDPDEEILLQAKKNAEEVSITNIRFLEASFRDLGGASDRYDIVTARMALRHTHDPLAALNELNRVLKPSGKLILADTLAPQHPDLAEFQRNLMYHRDPSHVQSNQLSDWENVLDRLDFDIDQIEIFPREHDFEKWATGLGADQDAVRLCAMMLGNASPRAKRHFRVIEVKNKPVSFTTWMVIIRAHPRHPAKNTRANPG